MKFIDKIHALTEEGKHLAALYEAAEYERWAEAVGKAHNRDAAERAANDFFAVTKGYKDWEDLISY